MTTATLTRGSTTVVLPLLDEGAGSPVVSRDLGKPEAGPENELAGEDPFWGDRWSQLEVLTLLGRFDGPTAYTDALDLADLIKSHSQGEPLQVDIDLPEYPETMDTAPAPEQDRALSLTYDPGWSDTVIVELSLTRVENVFGGGRGPVQTPTATGDGPVTISYGGETVLISSGLTVERTVGRPNSEINRSTGVRPNYIDNVSAAYDAFELSGQFLTDAEEAADTLRDMFAQPIGRDALTLDFNGVYGMGEMDVVASGSNAVRMVRSTGEAGVVTVPTINLRRVST